MQAVALGYLGRFEDADRALEPLDALEGDVGAAFRTARGQLLLAQDDAARRDRAAAAGRSGGAARRHAHARRGCVHLSLTRRIRQRGLG